MMPGKHQDFRIYEENGRRIVRGLGGYPAEPQQDLRALVRFSAEKYGDATGFKFRGADGGVEIRSYRRFAADIDGLGTALLRNGMGGRRIAIISENRYEWSVAFFSIVNGTGIAVPLDKYLPKNELIHLLQRGRCEALFFSNNYLEMVRGIADEGTTPVKHFLCLDTLTEGAKAGTADISDIHAWIRAGREALADGDRRFVDTPVDRETLSILLFTSGTTSLSKGVMLSHRNIVANLASIHACIKLDSHDTHLSLLPLHHTFENTIGQMLMIQSGACIAYCEGIKHVADNIREFGVTVLVVVPAILEAIYRQVQLGIDKSGKRKLLNALMTVSDGLRRLGIDVRRKLFKSIFEKLGPGLRLAVSGAAPLDPEVIRGFDRLGLIVYQGYGLTETSPVVASNNDFINVFGSIGHPVADVEVTIDNPDANGMGEILTRGENVMLGYYENDDASREVMEPDGWFHTGDLGTIDQNGVIRITGRAKSMIVLANGKKAFPEEFEMLLANITGVRDAFAWGYRTADNGVQICAKLVRDKDALKAANDGVMPTDEACAAIFEQAIREINTTLPQYKMIRYFLVTDTELVKTTTLKVKRSVEEAAIAAWLDKQGLDMRKASGLLV
jgi:long-chain acyl-CoA synthetase